MTDRPILFSGPMVRALLAGTKTQTRRIMKPQPPSYTEHLRQWHGKPDHWLDQDGSNFSIRCPYGQPGDRLWVRETFCLLDSDHWEDTGKPRDFLSSRYGNPRRNACAYQAEADTDADAIRCRKELGYKWTPSIHMPRWASRITLEITDVRVERLQKMNRGDAMEEGCPFPNMAQGDDPRRWYRTLWESINGAGSWDLNPWVWVISFKKAQP